MEDIRQNTGYREISTAIERSQAALEGERVVGIDIGLSPVERESLARVRVERDLEQFDFYGVGTDELREKLQSYFGQMGENTEQDLLSISDIVWRLSEGMREGFGEQSTWTMVRVSLPGSSFEVPRWHPDGKYFSSTKKQYKLVATLRGQDTLFGEAIDPEAVACFQEEESNNRRKYKDDPRRLQEEEMCIRRELAKVVRQTQIGGEGMAVIYLVGEKDAVLHSEPYITEPRIFIAVLPGSKKQITEWQIENGDRVGVM